MTSIISLTDGYTIDCICEAKSQAPIDGRLVCPLSAPPEAIYCQELPLQFTLKCTKFGKSSLCGYQSVPQIYTMVTVAWKEPFDGTKYYAIDTRVSADRVCEKGSQCPGWGVATCPGGHLSCGNPLLHSHDPTCRLPTSPPKMKMGMHRLVTEFVHHLCYELQVNTLTSSMACFPSEEPYIQPNARVTR